MGDSEPTWISWEEASRLAGIPVPTIEYATRVGRIARRPARGTLPSLDRESVLAWAEWQRELAANGRRDNENVRTPLRRDVDSPPRHVPRTYCWARRSAAHG